MTGDRELEAIERRAYQHSYSDGIIDIFVGVSLMWIGAAWIWLPDIAGLAGVLPAVFIAPALQARKRFLEPRVGYVKWAPPRRRWEQRNLAVLFAAGLGLFLLGIAMFVLVTETSAESDVASVLAPGLLAWLLALLGVGLAFVLRAWRMLGYAAVLAGAGIITAGAEENPGWPLLTAGAVVTVTGTAMLIRFVRRNPVTDTP